MPSHDFAVDLQSLIKAAQSAADAIKAKKDEDVSDWVPSESACGHDAVWNAVDSFQDRWDRGMNDMVNDVEEVAGRLGKVAMTYAEFDSKGAEALKSAAAAVTGLAAPPTLGQGG